MRQMLDSQLTVDWDCFRFAEEVLSACTSVYGTQEAKQLSQGDPQPGPCTVQRQPAAAGRGPRQRRCLSPLQEEERDGARGYPESNAGQQYLLPI